MPLALHTSISRASPRAKGEPTSRERKAVAKAVPRTSASASASDIAFYNDADRIGEPLDRSKLQLFSSFILL